MKQCRVCNIEKPLELFYLCKKGKLGRNNSCKMCVNKRQRERRKFVGDNPTYRYRYGKTVSELTEIRKQQNNSCAICLQEFTENFSTVVDHCHKQNKFRGFLCRTCNTGLGMFKDNITNLQNAIEYLKKHAD